MEDAAARPPPPLLTKVLRALNVSSGVLLLCEEEATREGAHKEVEVDGLVPLTEVAMKPAPPLERKKGQRRLGLG